MNKTKVLIKDGILVDPGNSKSGFATDIRISDGIVEELGADLESDPDHLVVDASSCYIVPGLFDLRCQLKDPGKEHKEDIYSASEAAVWSGFTGLLAQPTTDPVTQNKSGIWYLRNKSEEVLPNIYACGAATTDLKGTEITEMYDMHLAGAVAFSNGDQPYPDSGVLMRALLYNQSFGGLIMSHAEDVPLAANGSVNESPGTIHTGLKKRPGISEFLQVRKEIELLRYTGGRLHFSHISTAESVEVITKARKEGMKVTCDVSIWNLLFTDEQVDSFDSAYKCLPPLRTEKDRKALFRGLTDGTIDAIVSDHNPHNIERKKVEFDYAAFGNTSLQTLYPAMVRIMEEEGFTHEDLVRWLSVNPRKVLNLPAPRFDIGTRADLAVLDPHRTWKFDQHSNRSKSTNNPFFETELRGCCVYVQNGATYAIPTASLP